MTRANSPRQQDILALPPVQSAPKIEAKDIDNDLLFILTQPRGHGGKRERGFHQWLVRKLNNLGLQPMLLAEQCIFVQVGESKVLFSSHIDTVHDESTTADNKLVYDAALGHIALEDASSKDGKDIFKSGCLGADDGAGVWLMLKMIEAKIPGGYIFHRGEERGGIGSNAILKSNPDWVGQWNAAIAFDRAKDYEIITHQGGQRCCSDTFGDALAKEISKGPSGLDYKLSTGGSFTDTKVYRGVIPECTNVGVGYYFQHTTSEYLDYLHLLALRDALLKVEWGTLPIARDPKVTEYSSGYGRGYGRYLPDNSTPFDYPRSRQAAPAPAPAPSSNPPAPVFQSMIDEWLSMTRSEIADYIEGDPDCATEDIVLLAVEAAGLRAQLDAFKKMTLESIR